MAAVNFELMYAFRSWDFGRANAKVVSIPLGFSLYWEGLMPEGDGVKAIALEGPCARFGAIARKCPARHGAPLPPEVLLW